MRTITYPITPAHAGMSVERYLKQQHGYSTRTLVKLKHYPQGLQLNGRHARTVDLLQAGDTLAVTFLDSQEHGVEHFIRSNRRVESPMRTTTCWSLISLRTCPVTSPAATRRTRWQTSLPPTAMPSGWT